MLKLLPCFQSSTWLGEHIEVFCPQIQRAVKACLSAEEQQWFSVLVLGPQHCTADSNDQLIIKLQVIPFNWRFLQNNCLQLLCRALPGWVTRAIWDCLENKESRTL